MINTSQAYKNALYNNHRKFIEKATIYLVDGTELSISNANILQGGFKFDAATSSSGSFDIGMIVVQKFTMRINNIYDEFSTYDFYDAQIWCYAGMELEDGAEEWFRKGVFTVKEPDVSNGIVTLIGYDNACNFDTAYSNSTLTYPATRKQIVTDICNLCGVTDNTGQFDGCDEIVETRPADTYTCRDILSFIAQIGGLYGYCDNAGGFCFGWYDMTAFDGIGDGLDGGNLTDYTSGDTADGGNFTDYTSGDTVDGGGFEDDFRNFHHIYSTSSSSVSTDDVTITGIKVTVVPEQSTEEDEESTVTAVEYFSGADGYVLSISDNPLITVNNGQDIADHLFTKIGTMKFRPMTLSALGDPSMEAGDAMVFTDRKGNSYYGYITTFSYAIGQYASLVCDAEAPLSRKISSETYSAATQRAIQAQQTAKKVASRYSQAVNNMSQLAMNSLGFYQTTETLSDGSIITYMHDKPTLAESQTIYKRTIDGFFVSKDGGETYTSGFDSNGNAVLNVLSVIGINFDWAYGGTLTLGGSDNTNGVLNIVDADGDPIVIGNKDGLTIYKGSINFSDITDENGKSLENRLQDAASTGGSSGLTEEQVTEITKTTIKTSEITANQITSGTLDADKVTVNGLVVGKNVTMGANAKISWENITGTENVATTDDIPDDAYITQITKDTVTASYINALDITAKYVNVSDKSSIAGWNISASKIYSGDSNTGVAVMQRPSSETTYVFAAGGISHDSYKDCPYRVTKDGKLYASRLYVTGDPNVDSGEGFYIYDPINEEYLLLAKCDGGIEFPAFDYHFTGGLRIDKLFSGITPDVADTYKLGTASKYFNYVCSHVIRLGCSSYSDGNGTINSMWKDGEVHDVVNRSSDGLTSAFGWAGDATYKTATKLRGQTIQYPDSSGTTTLSDERLKKDFMLLDAWEDFYADIEPCAFKYVNGASGRSHIGFKAQQIQTALESNGLTTQDFAGFVQYTVNKDSDEWHGYDTEYGLIYTEFVALNTYMIQKLMKRIDTLESKINPVA